MRPLFDRICEPLADTLATSSELRDSEIKSLEAELNRLLNSRSYLSGKTIRKTRTILDYGLDSIVASGARHPSRLEEVVANVRYAIDVFEPRIQAPIVRGNYDHSDPTRLLVTVAGTLRESKEPIQFQIPLALPTTGSA
jgi:type VI secretion system lysozyme-like protein